MKAVRFPKNCLTQSKKSYRLPKWNKLYYITIHKKPYKLSCFLLTYTVYFTLSSNPVFLLLVTKVADTSKSIGIIQILLLTHSLPKSAYSFPIAWQTKFSDIQCLSLSFLLTCLFAPEKCLFAPNCLTNEAFWHSALISFISSKLSIHSQKVPIRSQSLDKRSFLTFKMCIRDSVWSVLLSE